MKIFILGGYGTFGRRLTKLLAHESKLTLIIAGRSIKRAEEFCNELHGNAAVFRPLYFDRNSLNIENELRSVQPDLLVDVSGPFQSYTLDRYRVIKACLTASINYLDIADGSDFVENVTQFDTRAKVNNMFVISGASTCPLLTAVVVRRLSAGFREVRSIKGGIAPSPYIDIGLNVIRAIASYSGKPITSVLKGQSKVSYAMTETMRYTICPPGYLPLSNRRFSLIDVPDLKVLPSAWPCLDSIWLGAGTEPEISHRILNGLAWLVRWRFMSNLIPFARLLHWTTNVIRWGEDRGGMFVSIEGSHTNGQKLERSWHLLAEHNSGPFIPVMGIAAIINRILDGKSPLTGARAANAELELDDYEKLFRTHAIFTGQWESIETPDSCKSLPLYQELLGSAWYQLPQIIRTMHSKNTIKAIGVAKIERGSGILSRCVGMLFNFPKAGINIPLQVIFDRKSDGELWTRIFNHRPFSSWHTKGIGRSNKLLTERFGPLNFSLALVVTAGKLHLLLRHWSFLGIRLPLFLAPNMHAYESEHDNRFHFYVEIKHSFTGLIVKYDGWLLPEV